MSARTLPAAAIPKGAVVRVVLTGPGLSSALRAAMGDVDPTDVTIDRVHNGDPVAGRIRWETKEFGDVAVGAADRFPIVSLP